MIQIYQIIFLTDNNIIFLYIHHQRTGHITDVEGSCRDTKLYLPALSKNYTTKSATMRRKNGIW